MAAVSDGKVVQQKKAMCIDAPAWAEVYSAGTKFLETSNKTTLI